MREDGGAGMNGKKGGGGSLADHMMTKLLRSGLAALGRGNAAAALCRPPRQVSTC
jgi:hypothetical protein